MSRMPTGEALFSFRVRRSRFTGKLVPVKGLEDVRQHLSRLKKDHHAASHICWAYRLFENDFLVENSSDAGEPAGTAGLPILNALKQADTVNAALFVIRIFGGQKLGRQGLTEAYGSAAGATLEQGRFRKWVPMDKIQVDAPLEYYGSLIRRLEDCGGSVVNDTTTDRINWDVSLPKSEIETFADALGEITNGQGKIK